MVEKKSKHLFFGASAKLIQLSQKRFAIVDKKDYEKVVLYNWCAHRHKDLWYAYGRVDGRMTFMHRFLLNPQRNQDVDHRNGNGLDNRRRNLRYASRSQNQQNKYVSKFKVTTPFKGVSKFSDLKRINRSKPWRASIALNGKSYYLGAFETDKEAAKAYDVKACKLFGEFAKTNFKD